MIVTRQLHDLQSRVKPIVLAAGFFDGVHIGHQSVIRTAIQKAHACEGESWVMTFDPHPMKVLNPQRAPRMLTATEHKLSLLRAHGVDGCIVLPFTKELAATDAKAFSDWLFHCAPSLCSVVVGENWRFGARAAGTPALLAEYGKSAGVTVQTIPPVRHGDETISSTRIREAIQHGGLQTAACMLGRPPGVLGTVIPGRAIGRTLGFPSANLDPHNEALPPLGVYAVEARIGNQFYPGALSYGTRPTFEQIGTTSTPLLELHVIDFSGSLYNTRIEAFFLKHLRDEWTFDSVEDLKVRIAQDVEESRLVVRQSGMPATLKAFLLAGTEHLEPTQ